jgi:acetolactate synthase I/II/III large subunit
MKASDLFVKCLEAEGVRRIYGVPGEENADLMMSLQKSAIDFVLTRHEQGAAFMAATHGRLTGEVGVCLGTLGPGATNLITGVADGNMDRAPLLAITGQGAVTRLHKESHQVMDVVSMYRPVTKWSCTVNHPDNIPEILHKAVKLAVTEKPGAVHVELPEDIAGQDSDRPPLAPSRPRRPVPDDKVMDQAWEKIRAAKSPLIIAGNGTIRRRASQKLREFCEATGIGALMTFMAKGAVDMDSDQCLFTVGMGQRDYPQLAIDSSDLIVTLGYDMVEYPPSKWNPGNAREVVHIDFLPAEADADYVPAVEVVGDLAHALWMLNQRVARDGVPDYDLDRQAALRRRMLQEFAAHAEDTTTGTIRPQKAVADMRAVLSPSDIVLCGVGAHKMWIARHFQAHEPGTCIISNGFCSMGMALPGAIAAAQSRPEARIMAIVGDGDLMMNLQEMETAARLGSDIAVLVWEDHAYGLISWKQEQEFGSHTPLGFTNPDWPALCASMGWKGTRCEDAAGLQDALRDALAHKGPAMVVIPVDYRENMLLTERLGQITTTF